MVVTGPGAVLVVAVPDVETDPAAAAVLGYRGLGAADAPIVVVPGGQVPRNPSDAELARAAGLGSGPAPGTASD